jgi:Caleosin related protein
LEEKLGDAGQPRANRAVTVNKPGGNPNRCALCARHAGDVRDWMTINDCCSVSLAAAQQPAQAFRWFCRFSHQKLFFSTCRSPNNRTVLQQHVDFFDRNNDGIIYPSDTFIGADCPARNHSGPMCTLSRGTES